MSFDKSTGLLQPSQTVSDTRINPRKAPACSIHTHHRAAGCCGPLWVCEGAFDALALLAAGVPRVVAIFGVQGWCWAWAEHVGAFVFALDADTAGQQQWQARAAGSPARPREYSSNVATWRALLTVDAGWRGQRPPAHHASKRRHDFMDSGAQ